MRAITLTQPWATLVAIGAKSIETRSWPTPHRGELAIHAAKAFPGDARLLVTTEPFRTALGGRPADSLPRGAIIAVVDLYGCLQFTHGTRDHVVAGSAAERLPSHEADFGDFARLRYGFWLRDVIALPQPVAARGMLSVWHVPLEVEDAIRAQLAAAQQSDGDASRVVLGQGVA